MTTAHKIFIIILQQNSIKLENEKAEFMGNHFIIKRDMIKIWAIVNR